MRYQLLVKSDSQMQKIGERLLHAKKQKKKGTPETDFTNLEKNKA